MQQSPPAWQEQYAERESLVRSITLISLGLSVFFVNLWDNPLVRECVELFWVAFFLVINGSVFVRLLRSYKQTYGEPRATDYFS